MDDLMKWLSVDLAAGLAELIARAVKVALIGFVVLQAKEWLDAGMFDTVGTGTDALLIAAGVFVVDAILMMALRRGAPRPSQARR